MARQAGRRRRNQCQVSQLTPRPMSRTAKRCTDGLAPSAVVKRSAGVKSDRTHIILSTMKFAQRCFGRCVRERDRVFRRRGADPLRGAASPTIRSPIAITTRTGCVLGKRMEDHLRAAVCYWHISSATASTRSAARHSRGPGSATTMASARLKADVAFEMFDLLGLPFFTFHDATSRPKAPRSPKSNRNVRADRRSSSRAKMETAGAAAVGHGQSVLNRRYMAGAATNPDPDVFAYAAAQVKNAIDVTHQLGGANYVLWGGREGYETLLNTDLQARAGSARPLPSAGRRVQAQDRLQGHDPHRAEAAGADQAPI